MAPAPSKSSTAGLRLPSGQRSPAGTTPIALFPAIARATTATARALRKHPVKTGMRPVVRPATTERRDPLRDGNISFVLAGMLKRLAGERLYSAPADLRGRASNAPTRSAAKRAPCSSTNEKG